MAEIFVSYARADRQRAQALAGALAREGWSVWWDRDIPPGRTFDDVIEEALATAKCVIVLWSRESIRSEWVKAEASEAARRHILVPVLGDQVMPPLEFRRIQSASLLEWASLTSNPDWSQLCQAVGRLVGQPTPSVPTLAAVRPLVPRPGWRAPSLFVAGALVTVGLAWVVIPRDPEPKAATPLDVASARPAQSAPGPQVDDGRGDAVGPSDAAASVTAPRPLESSRVGRRESAGAATSNASSTTAPHQVSSQTANVAPAHDGGAIRVVPDATVISAGASPGSTPVSEPITQSTPRANSTASGAASFDVVYTRGVFRESGQVTVSPDGLRYAESGGRSAFEATCGDVRRVQVMTVIVDGEQRMVELHTKDRVHRFTTDSTAARNGLVSSLSRTCGAR